MGSAPPAELHEVADKVYAYVQPDGSWCLSNAGFLVGRDTVTLVDTTATEARTRRLRDAVATVTDLAPRVLVNTHHHGDHTYGNFVFAPGATIIGHDRCPAAMEAAGLQVTELWPDVEWGAVRVTPPTVTFADRLTVYTGGQRVELYHVGPAHTDNDVVVWVPDADVLFAGDVVISGGMPFMLEGSVAGSLAAVARLRELGAWTVVSGHGPLRGPEILDVTERHLRWLQRLAREGLAAGVSPLEAAREAELGEYAAWSCPERLVANLHRAYAEEAGAPPGLPLDTATVMAEMVVYNGGRIPACLA